MRFSFGIVLLLLIGLSSCSKDLFKAMNKIPSATEPTVKVGKPLAVMFIELDCPISQYAVRAFDDVSKKYQDEVQFVSLIPSDHVTKEQINEFQTSLKTNNQILVDAEHHLVKPTRAATTPEVCLIDTSGKIIYQGLIDNKYKARGRPLLQASHNFLEAAIVQYLAGEPIVNPRTIPIGCKIEL